MNQYKVGDDVRCRGIWTDAGGNEIDPTSVSFKFKAPGATVTTYVYGTGTEVVREATGRYRVDLDAGTSGEWLYGFYSTGTGKAAAHRTFLVTSNPLV